MKLKTPIPQLRNVLSKKLNKESMNLWTHTVKIKLANKIKNKMEGNIEEGKEYNAEDNKTNRLYFHGQSQGKIPVKEIDNGIIITRNNNYIGVIEVLPLDFFNKKEEIQNSIIMSFSSLFTNAPNDIRIKIMSDNSDSGRLIASIKTQCKRQDEPLIQTAIDEYIEYIKELEKNNSVSKRYFILYSYSGDIYGKRSTNRSEIIESMLETKDIISNVLNNCGNLCLDSDYQDSLVAEFLYTFFNRKTSKTESFQERYDRVVSDYAIFNNISKVEKQAQLIDLIAPKGLYFTNRNYVYMDGTYYGYLGVLGSSWPTEVENGWLLYFDCGPNVDIDIICKKLPKEVVTVGLKYFNKISRGIVSDLGNKGNDEKYKKKSTKYNNSKDVYDHISTGEDLYDAAIILTFRATTARHLGRMKRTMQRSFAKNRVYTDDGFLFAENYFNMTMPFFMYNKTFNLLKHNILSSKMSSLYPFTSFELFDPRGFVLGENENRSIVSLNNFNTKLYSNANMLILGTSGAGKTFTEQLIGKRMLLNGMRCFFLIPKKGHEYRNGCNDLNGTYILLTPGSKDCINFLEIRPEIAFDISQYSSESENEIVPPSGSLLARKVNDILIWLQLLFGENESLTVKEYGLLNPLLYDLYGEIGITNDDSSIYENISTGQLKKMPIFSDLERFVNKYPELERIQFALKPFTEGNCVNLNAQTNVDLTKPYIVFNIDEDYINEKLFPSFLYIGFNYVYSAVKESALTRDAIFLDEVWKLMTNENSAKQVQNMVKLVRGYGGGTVIATQEINDFINKTNNFGASVISLSEITLLLKMKDEELDIVKNIIKLTSPEQSDILSFSTGSALLFSGKDRIRINIKPTKRELASFSTDVNHRIRNAASKEESKI